jgi:hypothetical protein
MADKQPVRLNATVSAEAHDGWRRLAADQGVTVAAYLEAAGLMLAGDLDRVTRSALTRELVAEARRIAEARRHRGAGL